MPKRTRTDHARIVELYEECGSGMEVARRMGISDNTVYTVLVRSRGNCRCGQPLSAGKKHCDACLEALRNSVKTKRERRRLLGLCRMCDEPFKPPSTQFCAEHRKQDVEWRRKQDQRKKRGCPNLGIPSRSQKERALRRKYGEAAVEIWRECDATCVLCGISYSDKTIHVHHIDNNHQNNVKDNLTLLCFRCHRLVHLLTEHPSPNSVLKWIQETYHLEIPRRHLASVALGGAVHDGAALGETRGGLGLLG